MKNVNYLVGNDQTVSSPLPVFDDSALEFLSLLSRKLMESPLSREYPDVSAFAFWCRKANLNSLKEHYGDSKKRLGRGLCFHIAPGNIPINFAFSYVFGLLAGCSNIVRLSSKDFPQIAPFCKIFNEAVEAFPEIKNRTAFVRYDHNDEVTKAISEASDARVIWGGDETIKRVRAMASKPRCVDVCFADRYSVCILDGAAVLNSDQKQMDALASAFYNDTYLMDQNACSSPQILFWLNASKEAVTKFWKSVTAFAEKKYVLQPAVAVDKYTHAFEDILDGVPLNAIKRDDNLLYRVQLSGIAGDVTEYRGKGGYFYEYPINEISDIKDWINEKFQTITYYGVNPEEIGNFITDNNISGVDRVVPVGKAMDIDIVWDGFELFRTLSRVIDIR